MTRRLPAAKRTGGKKCAVPEQPGGPPCHLCDALCCRYYALELDPPEDEEDFDDLRWYLLHEKTWIWVDDGEWFLQVDEPCRFLDEHGRCTIYERRPRICREYGDPEYLEDPDEPLCDWYARDEHHEHEFREPEELEAYARRFLRKKAAERRRRSEAAKKAWRTRRRREAARKAWETRRHGSSR